MFIQRKKIDVDQIADQEEGTQRNRVQVLFIYLFLGRRMDQGRSPVKMSHRKRNDLDLSRKRKWRMTCSTKTCLTKVCV
jgi:hypothetical protein